MTTYAEEQLNAGKGVEFKTKFNGAQNLNDNEFLFMFADAITLTIQYGGRTKLCDAILGKTIT